MTKEPKTAEMTSTMAFVLNMMSEGGYRHMPIVDEENRPVGMVSVKDLVDFIAKKLSTDLADLTVDWDY